MGKKGKHRRFKAKGVRTLDQAFQNFHVAYVQTIKSTYGHCGGLLYVVFGNVLDCYHEYKVIKRLIFGIGLSQLDDRKITSSFFNNHSISMLLRICPVQLLASDGIQEDGYWPVTGVKHKEKTTIFLRSGDLCQGIGKFGFLKTNIKDYLFSG